MEEIYPEGDERTPLQREISAATVRFRDLAYEANAEGAHPGVILNAMMSAFLQVAVFAKGETLAMAIIELAAQMLRDGTVVTPRRTN